MKEEEDSRGKGPINGNTCQCPDALTCEHCKDKDTDVTSEDDKYNIIAPWSDPKRDVVKKN
jgi:hypothetical protein